MSTISSSLHLLLFLCPLGVRVLLGAESINMDSSQKSFSVCSFLLTCPVCAAFKNCVVSLAIPHSNQGNARGNNSVCKLKCYIMYTYPRHLLYALKNPAPAGFRYNHHLLIQTHPHPMRNKSEMHISCSSGDCLGFALVRVVLLLFIFLSRCNHTLIIFIRAKISFDANLKRRK